MNKWKQMSSAAQGGSLTDEPVMDHHVPDLYGETYSNAVYRGHYKQGDLYLAPDGHIHLHGGGVVPSHIKRREGQLRRLMNYTDTAGGLKHNSTASPTNLLIHLNARV